MTIQTTNSPHRRFRQAIALLAGALLLLAACSSEPIPIAVPAAAQSSGESAAAAVAPVPPGPPVSTASSEFGDILVNENGLSVYGFTDDVDGISTCAGGCAQAWPPVLVPTAGVPDGLDQTIFSVVGRADGTNQLKAGVWPLYLFAGDTAPGQTAGHLSGDVWFLATPSGGLVDVAGAEAESATASDAGSDAVATPQAEVAAEPAEAPVAADPVQEGPTPVDGAFTSFGDVLVTSDGLSLYGFTKDVDGASACEGGCAEAWPPLLVPTGDLPDGLDAELFSVIARGDGTWQLKAGIWPLYRFAGDTAPGQTTGHLSGDVWFLAQADGKLVDFAPAPAAPAAADPEPTAVPAAPPTPAPAPTAAPTAAPAPTEVPAGGAYGDSGYGDSSSDSDY